MTYIGPLASKLRIPSLVLALAASVTACGDNGSSPSGADGTIDEQDLTEAPYLEVVDTADAQGKRIVAHGLPAVSFGKNVDGSSYTRLALLAERLSAAPGYVGFTFDERNQMGSFTGSEMPLLGVDARTSPPTVTLLQDRIDQINERLKSERWSRLIERPATNNTVNTDFGFTVAYDGAAATYPRLHVHEDGTEILNKSVRYFADYAFGPQGCTYAPELASAAISKRHKALLLRVHYATSGDGCAIADGYFTEALP